jgi:hypothetical protein
MKRYCIDCGSPTEYTVKKPTFCSNCGNPFEKTTQTAQPVVQKVLEQKRTIAKKQYIPEPELIDDEDNDFDDENEIREVPNISNLEIEAQHETPQKGVKLGSILGTETDQPKKEKNKTRSKKTSKKQILEDFAKEAGSLRKSKK